MTGIFTAELPEQNKEEFLNIVNRINRHTFEKLAVVIAIVCTFLLLIVDYPFYSSGLWGKNPFYYYIFLMHLGFIAGCSALYGLSKIFAQNSLDRIFFLSFCVIGVLWCAFLAQLGQLVRSDVILYIVGIFGVSTAFYLAPITRTFLLLIAQIFFLTGLQFFTPPKETETGIYINSTVSIVLCWVINKFLFRTKIKDFLQYKELERQKNEIHDLNVETQALNEHLHESNSQLLTLNSEKNEFLAIAAHDLKNPLSGIMLNAELVRTYLNSMSQEEIYSNMEKIEHTSRHMLDILSKLLNINALETGKFFFKKEKIALSCSLKEIIDDNFILAKEKNLQIHFSGQGEEIFVFADRVAFYAIMENLLSNAIKFSPCKKNIFVRIYAYNKEKICIEVEDEGPGFTQDDKEKLFSKFARLSAKPTGNEHSTGLGLSIVKLMVEALGGRIYCESKYGSGAKFTVVLPVMIDEVLSE